MTDPRPGLVFDTGPLRHFAMQGWLGVLKYLSRDAQVMIPETVEVEFRDQSRSDPQLRQVLEDARVWTAEARSLCSATRSVSRSSPWRWSPTSPMTS